MKDPASKGVGFYCKKKVNKVAKRLGSEKNKPYLYISRKGNGSQS
jgi:predicted transcriptional regulator YheO